MSSKKNSTIRWSFIKLTCQLLVVICVVLLLFVLFYVLFVCKCVLYYWHQVTTQLQLTNIYIYTKKQFLPVE